MERTELPAGWHYAKLGRCVDIFDSKRLPINADKRASLIEGKPQSSLFPYYGATGQVGWINGYLFDTELVLLGEDGAPFLESTKPKAYLVSGKTWVNNHAHVLSAKPEVTSNKYICHYLNLFDYSGYVTGTTRLKLNQAAMASIPVPLAPLSEQQRIVEYIETQFTRLDAAVAALKRVQANLRRYRAAVLKAACTGQLVPTEAALAGAQGRGYEGAAALLDRILHERRARWEADHPGKQYKEPAGPDTSALPELPEGWCWATVEQVAEHRLGKMLDQVKNKGTPVPYLRNINVRWFSFDFSDLQAMRIQPDEIEDVSVRDGDLVVCEGGEPGRCAVWNKGDSTMVIQKALHRVRPHGDVLPWFLAIKLRADASNGSLERYFTGSTIKHFTGESLRRYVLPLAPLAEQRRIVDEVQRHISLIEDLEQETSASMARAARLRQSILQRAFSGQLLGQAAAAAVDEG